jgi:ribosomal protein S18 acetylase RimI-like enzyme
MDLVETSPTGLAYLALVTELLQSSRLADPTGGIWEAADLQWWWRRDQHPDPRAQTFWLRDGRPVAAAILTDWGRRWGFDVVGGRALEGPRGELAEDAAWSRGIAMVDLLGLKEVETSIREDDDRARHSAVSFGFEPTDERSIATWMDADAEAGAERPLPPLPHGFHVVDRRGDARPHPMIGRNGEQVEARLRECSLYRPDLDLAVRGPEGDVAGYALFWADPVTGVGELEPMRTEDAYQGRGIGRHLLAVGLARLRAAGCSRLLVAHMEGNEAARRLYEGAGFRAAYAVRTYARRSG